MIRSILIMILGLYSTQLFSITPADVLASLREQASSASDFKEFSIERGQTFFITKSPDSNISCSTCHTENPAAIGKHNRTEKEILPLAPSVNPERFTEMAKVEKWFKRNCNDVLDRECTAQEKGDVLTYLISVKDEVALNTFKSTMKKRFPASKKNKK